MLFSRRRAGGCVALLKRFLREDDGVAVVVGPVGTGKTLLARRLLGALEEGQEAVMVSNVHSPEISALLKALLHDLSLPQDGDETALRLRLSEFLMERFAERDAHHHRDRRGPEPFGPAARGAGRLLTNLESRRRKAVQVALFGQPKLAATLERPELEGFRQRVALVARLAPLDTDEAVDYLHFGVELAGGSPEAVFTAEALSEIVDRAGGAPRRLNQLAHRAMMLACRRSVVDRHRRARGRGRGAFAVRTSAPVRPNYPTHHSEAALGQLRTPMPAEDPVEDLEAHVIEVGAPMPASGAATAAAPRVIAPMAARAPARHRGSFPERL